MNKLFDTSSKRGQQKAFALPVVIISLGVAAVLLSSLWQSSDQITNRVEARLQTTRLEMEALRNFDILANRVRQAADFKITNATSAAPLMDSDDCANPGDPGCVQFPMTQTEAENLGINYQVLGVGEGQGANFKNRMTTVVAPNAQAFPKKFSIIMTQRDPDDPDAQVVVSGTANVVPSRFGDYAIGLFGAENATFGAAEYIGRVAVTLNPESADPYIKFYASESDPINFQDEFSGDASQFQFPTTDATPPNFFGGVSAGSSLEGNYREEIAEELRNEILDTVKNTIIHPQAPASLGDPGALPAGYSLDVLHPPTDYDTHYSFRIEGTPETASCQTRAYVREDYRRIASISSAGATDPQAAADASYNNGYAPMPNSMGFICQLGYAYPRLETQCSANESCARYRACETLDDPDNPTTCLSWEPWTGVFCNLSKEASVTVMNDEIITPNTIFISNASSVNLKPHPSVTGQHVAEVCNTPMTFVAEGVRSSFKTEVGYADRSEGEAISSTFFKVKEIGLGSSSEPNNDCYSGDVQVDCPLGGAVRFDENTISELSPSITLGDIKADDSLVSGRIDPSIRFEATIANLQQNGQSVSFGGLIRSYSSFDFNLGHFFRKGGDIATAPSTLRYSDDSTGDHRWGFKDRTFEFVDNGSQTSDGTLNDQFNVEVSNLKLNRFDCSEAMESRGLSCESVASNYAVEGFGGGSWTGTVFSGGLGGSSQMDSWFGGF